MAIQTLSDRIFLLLLVLLFFIPTTYFYIRGLFFHYFTLETNHSINDENLSTKMWLVWKHNLILSLLAAGVTILYGPFISGLGIPVSLETVAASAVLFSAANITVRVSSYGYRTGDPDIADECIIRLKQDSHNAMYSFLVSIWILLFLGICLNVLNGDVVFSFTLDSINPVQGLYYALMIMGLNAAFSIISELLMWKAPLAVPEVLVDDMD